MMLPYAVLIAILGLSVSHGFVLQPWAGNTGCNDPKYWCQSIETAKECEVLEYCQIGWERSQTKDQTGNIGIRSPKPDASPVKVTLYYESLCPDCRQFILDQWFSAFTKLYSSGILDVDLVPYGNAREYQYGGQWIFYCQHGANECLGNLIETCAIHAAGNASVYAPFIHCMEYYGPTTSNLQYCATTSHMDYATINSCVQGSLGNQLQHQMALKTDALNPPHQYVPWITVNGVHTDQIQNAVQTNMLGYVCSMYQGTKPAVCSSKTVKRAKVCYKD
ncbi:gamma-interferon-inducible lysosomal thiol reductase-like [Rhopilema esculentum]|uniref:gamma-interferon-inducible lysosomal thiol reductase-like n=1 Tax=Rhopilema esculentum TaxID=499914 RepID=UPI0031D8B716